MAQQKDSIMEELKQNGYVRWKGLVTILIVVLGGLLSFTYNATSKNVSKETFQQFEKRFETHSMLMLSAVNEIRANLRDDEIRSH